jgi:DNA-binding NtrC family response regulator
VAINCAGLSEELAASLLFGHRRGSFTGAVNDQQGLFEAAHGGTLFLDEIGELPLRVQTTLLRVLEEHAVLRLGESQPRAVDVRVCWRQRIGIWPERRPSKVSGRICCIAFESRVSDCLPCASAVRICRCWSERSWPISVPRQANGSMGSATKRWPFLLEYDWPGNVRELRNALEYAVIQARSSLLHSGDLPPELLESIPLTDMEGSDPDDADVADADRLASRVATRAGEPDAGGRLAGHQPGDTLSPTERTGSARHLAPSVSRHCLVKRS